MFFEMIYKAHWIGCLLRFLIFATLLSKFLCHW